MYCRVSWPLATPHPWGTNIRICKYIWIYLDKFSVIFSKADKFVYSFVIYFYWPIYLDSHSFNIYERKYIWISKNVSIGYNRSKTVQYWSKIKQNMNMANIAKNCFLANYLIFEYIRIFWTNIFICKTIHWFFLGWIYLDIHLWCFYYAEYILILICPISMLTNIFICPKKRIFVPHCSARRLAIRPLALGQTKPYSVQPSLPLALQAALCANRKSFLIESGPLHVSKADSS